MCYKLLMRTQDKYILERNGRYYYERRVPTEYAKFDTRRYVKKALKTKSLEVARSLNERPRKTLTYRMLGLAQYLVGLMTTEFG